MLVTLAKISDRVLSSNVKLSPSDAITASISSHRFPLRGTLKVKDKWCIVMCCAVDKKIFQGKNK